MLKALTAKLHSRLGDFWWYAMLIFLASRAADCLNAFIGIWLVPKYVGPEDLGAVMPLLNFAGIIAMPIGVFASTFRNELTTLAATRRYGEMKSLMRGVFIAAALCLVLAIVACRIVFPVFLAKIRIVEGSLGVLILATSFTGAIAPVYQNALQALKKFKSISVINLLGAPIRFLTMVLAMPFRPLSGYFVGQAATPAFNIVASLFSLRRELAVKASPYWCRATAIRFSRLFILLSIGSLAGGLAGLAETTILRQQLPSVESAGYYMVTRFSDISGFLAASLVFTLFPFAAEMNAEGRDSRPLIFKIYAAIMAFSVPLAVLFWLFGEPILAAMPHGEEYARFWWAIPWMVGMSTIGNMISTFTTVEIAANKFKYYVWFIPITLAYPAALMLVADSITSLKDMLCCMTAFNVIRLSGCILAMLLARRVAPEGA